MSFWDDVGDALEFEWYHAKELWNDIKEDPERLFIGAIDPISSDMWGAVTGKDYEPMVNQWGGATNQRFVGFEAEGGNAEPAMFMHDTAKKIAQSYALGYGAESAGAYAEGQGASPEAASGIEQGIKQIGGAAIDPPPPDPDDPDLRTEEEKRKKELKATFGTATPAELGTAKGVDVPGAVRIVHDPYGQVVPPDPDVVPTFGRV